MKATKWKKRDRKLNNSKFSFKMRQKNLSKSTKMFKVSQTWFTAWQHVGINYSRKRESVSFPTIFAVILSDVALLIVQKDEFNFELIMYITLFVF